MTQDELAEIQQRYRVRESDWLALEIAYEGRGEAAFLTNPGTIRGPTSIRYREDGTLELFQMTVHELVAEQHPGEAAPDALFLFVNALPILGGFGLTLSPPGRPRARRPKNARTVASEAQVPTSSTCPAAPSGRERAVRGQARRR